MIGIAYYESPIGTLRIKAVDEKLREVEFVDVAGEDETLTPVVSQTVRELGEYFAGRLRAFSVPLAPLGTSFQKSVWEGLQHIPFGTTLSYAGLAKQLNNFDAIRAVGQANHVNPIAIIIPCHRVIGSDRTLVGYGGGLWRKRWLLDHELHAKEGTHHVALSSFAQSVS